MGHKVSKRGSNSLSESYCRQSKGVNGCGVGVRLVRGADGFSDGVCGYDGASRRPGAARVCSGITGQGVLEVPAGELQTIVQQPGRAVWSCFGQVSGQTMGMVGAIRTPGHAQLHAKFEPPDCKPLSNRDLILGISVKETDRPLIGLIIQSGLPGREPGSQGVYGACDVRALPRFGTSQHTDNAQDAQHGTQGQGRARARDCATRCGIFEHRQGPGPQGQAETYSRDGADRHRRTHTQDSKAYPLLMSKPPTPPAAIQIIDSQVKFIAPSFFYILFWILAFLEQH